MISEMTVGGIPFDEGGGGGLDGSCSLASETGLIGKGGSGGGTGAGGTTVIGMVLLIVGDVDVAATLGVVEELR